MLNFSDRTISPSCIDLINKKIIEFQQQGKKIIKLNIGNLDTERPIKISEISDAEFNNSNHYTNIKGDLELRQLVVDQIKKENGLIYDVNREITIVSGTRAGIFYTFNSLLNEDDEVIIPRGTWVTYFNMLENFKGKAVLADTKVEDNYKLTPEILESCITSKTKAFVITNPGNPTGAIYSMEELKALLDVLKKYPQMIVMSDEIYSNIYFTNIRVNSIAEATEDKELLKRIVIFNGFSKSISMAGDRIAYVLCYNQELLQRIYNCQVLINSNTNNIAQIIAKKIIKKDLTEYYKSLINRLKKNRDFAYDFINNNIKGLKAEMPDGALYMMIDYSALKNNTNPAVQNDVAMCEYLLQNGVATTPGEAFRIPNSFRICFACSFEEIKEGVELIKQAVEKL
ncbi:MAG TPA: aminotransferase class I/II-fold pyridoxal phosphate-dependent enzyme [Rickettsiales bacterium]|nr:aminotransferase class I/II-fold pyridoxal phosphate-dependent enzyme [Rickettsiales bacterium]